MKLNLFALSLSFLSLAFADNDIYRHCTLEKRDGQITIGQFERPDHWVAECGHLGHRIRTRQDMNLCIVNVNGRMLARDLGSAFKSCYNCKLNPYTGTQELQCECKIGKGDEATFAGIDLRKLMTVDEAGYTWCFGHRSAPV